MWHYGVALDSSLTVEQQPELTQWIGSTEAQLADPTFNMAKALGFTQEELVAANDYCCGTMTIEGAPQQPGFAPSILHTAHVSNPVFGSKPLHDREDGRPLMKICCV